MANTLKAGAKPFRSMRAALLLLVLMAPYAAAQAPTPAPTLDVVITKIPADFGAMASNSSAVVPVEATIQMGNVVCPQGATISVTFTVTAKMPTSFFAAIAQPAKVDVQVPGPAYIQAPFQGVAKSAIAANTTLILSNVSIPV